MSDSKEIRNRLSRLEDRLDHVLDERVAELEHQVARQREIIMDLDSGHEQLEAQVNSLIDTDCKEESSPERRKVALRQAMIRAARDRAGSTGGGVTWWWKEVRDQLASHGHGDFSKPVYHAAIEDASEADGFSETTKEVLSGGQRREVKAIQLNPDNVTRPDLRNQLTTRVGGSEGSEAVSADGGTVETDD